MDEFYSNCSIIPGCNISQIDYIAFHDYQGDVSKLLSRAEGMMRRYGKPTWITEFAINKWARLQHGTCDDCNITRPMVEIQPVYNRPKMMAFTRQMECFS